MNLARKKYKVMKKSKVYYSTGSLKKTKAIIKTGLDHGQPVMIFVVGRKCSDLANSAHALLLLGYNNDGTISFIDSANRVKDGGYKKRNLDKMAKCLVNDDDSFFKIIVFSFS